MHKNLIVIYEPLNFLVKLIFVVKSAIDNSVKRQTIRETWGTRSLLKAKNMALFFVVGKPFPLEEKMKSIKLESDQHGDILFCDFVDTYYNITIEVNFCRAMALKARKI